MAGGNKISWVALRKVCAEPWRDVYLIPGYMAKTRELSQKIGGGPENSFEKLIKRLSM